MELSRFAAHASIHLFCELHFILNRNQVSLLCEIAFIYHRQTKEKSQFASSLEPTAGAMIKEKPFFSPSLPLITISIRFHWQIISD
jgi:hypothetical protein